MTESYMKQLRLTVSSGDYGKKQYLLPEVYKRIPRFPDRYIDGGFSWKVAVESNAPALVFRQACNDIAGFQRMEKIPDDPKHMREILETEDIPRFVVNGAQARWEENVKSPSDQLAVNLRGYHSKLRWDRSEAYVYDSEYWLQAGNRETPVHIDHGRVVTYIPPCARHCFKVWAFFSPGQMDSFKWADKPDSFNRMLLTPFAQVLVQLPGDVVYLNNLVPHAVLMGFRPGTLDQDKWGGSFGDVIVRAQDRLDSFRYATQIASGSRKGSKAAWRSLLSVYCTMEGREWDEAKYEDEKRRFLETLPAPEKSVRAKAAAKGKWGKRKRLIDKLSEARKAKKRSDLVKE